jgi:hypothetical protein
VSKVSRPSSAELPALRLIASYDNGLSFLAATRLGLRDDRLEELTRKGLIQFKGNVYRATTGARVYL